MERRTCFRVDFLSMFQFKADTDFLQCAEKEINISVGLQGCRGNGTALRIYRCSGHRQSGQTYLTALHASQPGATEYIPVVSHIVCLSSRRHRDANSYSLTQAANMTNKQIGICGRESDDIVE